MAITPLNDYAIGDVNFNTMMETLDKTFKGKNLITLSAYDTTAAPDVKVGSVFEDNGALFIVDTADITPTGYAGMNNSATFYLIYDESVGTLIYQQAAPTWNDALQGWYTGNDRAFFSMYKDSGGTLYENKNLLVTQNNIAFANDINVPGKADITGDITYNSRQITSTNYLHADTTQDVVFDKLDAFIPTTGNIMEINGSAGGGGFNRPLSRVERTNATTMTYYFISSGVVGSATITNGSATALNISASW